jgi:hypothetical protein
VWLSETDDLTEFLRRAGRYTPLEMMPLAATRRRGSGGSGVGGVGGGGGGVGGGGGGGGGTSRGKRRKNIILLENLPGMASAYSDRDSSSRSSDSEGAKRAMVQVWRRVESVQYRILCVLLEYL